jgi:hypothetical protein
VEFLVLVEDEDVVDENAKASLSYAFLQERLDNLSLFRWRRVIEFYTISLSRSRSIRTDLEGTGAVSHLAITQARVEHSGVYTCSVSDSISQSVRLHIIDGEGEKNKENIISQSKKIYLSKNLPYILQFSK